MAVTISVGIKQNSQNVANNTSNVTVNVTASWTYGSYNATGQCTGSITIDGTKYSFTGIKFNVNETTSGSQVVMTKTVNVTHAADGKKTLSCSASFDTRVSSGTVTASASKTLTTIPRASSLTVSNGTLGTSLSITINRAASSFTHTITYKCGSASGTVGTGLGASATWSTSNGNTLALSNQNTKGTTVAVTFTLTTYSGSTAIGTSTKSITMNIPSSVVPSISNIALSEASGVVPSGYGYVQNHSKLKIVTTSAGAYGSTIKTISVSYDGVAYSGGTVTTNVLGYSGTRTVSVTVTDTRGRTATKTASVTVQAYSQPVINSFTVVRCNADRSLNEQGEYMLISYNASITALGNKNGKSLVVKYKKSNETSYTERQITMSAYSVSGSLDPVPADSGSSFNIGLVVADTFATVTKNLTLSTAFTIMHFKADGTGIGIGKIAETANVADFGMSIKASKGFSPIPIVEGTDLNDLKTPNMYYCKDGGNATYKNSPLPNAVTTFTLEVKQGGNDGFTQIITTISKDAVLIYQRAYYSGAWGDWNTVYTNDGKVLWSGALLMTDTETITLSEQVKAQANGIVLVFSAYANGSSANYDFQDIFVSKFSVAQHSMNVRSCVLGSVGFWQVGCKALSISNGQIFGDARNDDAGTQNGITYNNAGYCLRYVIGV